MTEPIIDPDFKSEYVSDHFQPEVVELALRDFEQARARYSTADWTLTQKHYSQSMIDLQPGDIEKLLQRLSLNPSNAGVVTVFGGYTGEFAERLSQLGFTVIFTDPLKEYVEMARERGLESHVSRMEEIPSEISDRTDLFASFECYMPVQEDRSSLYTTMRMLAAKKGFIFAVSKKTQKELEGAGGKTKMKGALRHFAKVYDTKRVFRENSKLRIYHFSQDDESRELIERDCDIVKLLFDSSEGGESIDEEAIRFLSEASGLPPEEVNGSISRYWQLWQSQMSKVWGITMYPKNRFYLFSRCYFYKPTKNV
jgi:hypothetical protein